MDEDDFGAVHNQGHLVADAEGMVYAAHYANGVWWEGPPIKGGVRIQLQTKPIALFNPQASA